MYLYTLGCNPTCINWSDAVTDTKKDHILKIDNDSWDTELKFNATELIKYARGRDTRLIEIKIKQKINSFTSS